MNPLKTLLLLGFDVPKSNLITQIVPNLIRFSSGFKLTVHILCDSVIKEIVLVYILSQWHYTK